MAGRQGLHTAPGVPVTGQERLCFDGLSLAVLLIATAVNSGKSSKGLSAYDATRSHNHDAARRTGKVRIPPLPFCLFVLRRAVRVV